MSGGNCGRISVLSKIKQQQTWTSHQVVLLDEMNSVAGDALENQRRSLLSEATAEIERHQRGKVTSICKKISRVFDATCQKFEKEVQVQQGCE